MTRMLMALALALSLALSFACDGAGETTSTESSSTLMSTPEVDIAIPIDDPPPNIPTCCCGQTDPVNHECLGSTLTQQVMGVTDCTTYCQGRAPDFDCKKCDHVMETCPC